MTKGYRDYTHELGHTLLRLGQRLHIDAESGQMLREIGVQLRVVADITVDIYTEMK